MRPIASPLLAAAIGVLLAAPAPALADYDSYGTVGTDPSGDDTYGDDHFNFYSPFPNQTITGPAGVPLGWIDLLGLDMKHDDVTIEAKLTLADIPAPGEDMDEVMADPSKVRKLIDLATGTIRYAVQFRIGTKSYITAADVEYVAGVPVYVGPTYWGGSDYQGATTVTSVSSTVALDSATDTVTFTVQRESVGSPAAGTDLTQIIASTWSGEIPSSNPTGANPTGAEGNRPVSPLGVLGDWSLFAVNDWLPDCRRFALRGSNACSTLTYNLSAPPVE